MNLSDREREAKVKSVQEIINEEIWTMGTPKFNTRQIAERILRTIDETEMEFDVYYQEARLASGETVPF